MKTAVVYLTHRLWPDVLQGFRRLRRQCPAGADAFLLVDATAAERAIERVPADLEADVHAFTAEEVLDIPYPRKVSDASEAEIYGGNLDLVFLHYPRLFPGYDRYWTVEYDVAFTGRWSKLLGHFADAEADLLGTTLTRFDEIPEWNHWPAFDTGGEVGRERWIRGFYPCVRVSRPAIAAVDRAYRRGWTGHSEAVMATAIGSAGLTIRDLGGEGEFVADEDRNRFYTNTPTRLDLDPGTFVYRPVRPSPGFRRDKLWHPVKPRASRWSSWRERIGRGLERIRRAVTARVAPSRPDDGRAPSPGGE